MKIGFVLDDSLDKTDGVQQYVLTLGSWYAKHGHNVHYLVGHTERTDVRTVHSLGRNIQVHFNQNRMSTPLPVSKKKIQELFARHDFDVLHVQLPYSPFLAARIVNLAPPTTAIIGTFHILPFSKIESVATRALALLLRTSRKRFDRIVSVSVPAKSFAKKRFRVQSTVVPNAIDLAQFRASKKIKKYDDGKLNIVYLGRLVERKGCLHLLKAISLLASKNQLQNVRVIIAGKGTLLSELQAFVRKHRLSHTVQFIGYVTEEKKPSLLASAHLAIMPSLGGESFGIVLIEAMAAGAEVVIAGDNAGYRTVMGGHEEQIVDPTDTVAFAKIIKHFLYSNEARRRAEKWQKQHVQQYDVKIVGRDLLDLYNEALRNKSGVQ